MIRIQKRTLQYSEQNQEHTTIHNSSKYTQVRHFSQGHIGNWCEMMVLFSRRPIADHLRPVNVALA